LLATPINQRASLGLRVALPLKFASAPDDDAHNWASFFLAKKATKRPILGKKVRRRRTFFPKIGRFSKTFFAWAPRT